MKNELNEMLSFLNSCELMRNKHLCTGFCEDYFDYMDSKGLILPDGILLEYGAHKLCVSSTNCNYVLKVAFDYRDLCLDKDGSPFKKQFFSKLKDDPIERSIRIYNKMAAAGLSDIISPYHYVCSIHGHKVYKQRKCSILRLNDPQCPVDMNLLEQIKLPLYPPFIYDCAKYYGRDKTIAMINKLREILLECEDIDTSLECDIGTDNFGWMGYDCRPIITDYEGYIYAKEE